MSAQQRANLIIGFGSFGLNVLHNLINALAPRGVLQWETQPGIGQARKLSNISFLHLINSEENQNNQANRADQNGMMRDLYQQIETVNSNNEALAASKAKDAVNRMLKSSNFDINPDQTIGLDVFIIAQPKSKEYIGILDQNLRYIMKELDNVIPLQRGAGSRAIQYLEILDFDEYWSSSKTATDLRETLVSSMTTWERRRERNLTRISRCFLSDSYSSSYREEHTRIEEIVLFIEIVLFENVRSKELQNLFQTPNLSESLVATFGVRSLERGVAKMRQSAAAKFAHEWLEHLFNHKNEDNLITNSKTYQLLSNLDYFDNKNPSSLLSTEEFDQLIDEEIKQIRENLLNIKFENHYGEDWPQAVIDEYRTLKDNLDQKISNLSQHKMLQARNEALTDLDSKLNAAIDDDLNDDNNPLTNKSMIDLVNKAVENLKDKPVPESNPNILSLFQKRLKSIYKLYRKTSSNLIDLTGLRIWWPLYSFLLAIFVSPILHLFIAKQYNTLPQQWQTDPLITWLNQINHEFIWSLPLSIIFWLLFGGYIQRLFKLRLDQFYLEDWHPIQGRAASAIKEFTAESGQLRIQLISEKERQLNELRAIMRAELSHEVGKKLKKLQERHREAMWLKHQLHSFTHSHELDQKANINGSRRSNGINGSNGSNGFNSRDHQNKLAGNSSTGVRSTLSNLEEAKEIENQFQHQMDFYVQMHRDLKPLHCWNQDYPEDFVKPLEFVNRLADTCKDPLDIEREQLVHLRDTQQKGPLESQWFNGLKNFIQKNSNQFLAFRVGANAPAPKKYALFPRQWAVAEITNALEKIDIDKTNQFSQENTEFAYLLTVQTGIDKSTLKKS